MADRYLLESGSPDGYLNEDGSGVLILEGVTNLTLDIDTPGGITIAGQSVAASISVPVSAGSVTIAGQSLAASLSVPLEAGAVTVSGQSVSASFDLPVDAGAITIAGQTVDATIGISVELDAGSITIAGQLVDMALALPVSRDQPSGGYEWFNAVDRERQRRKARLLEQQADDEAVERIEDATTREIALLLREQEAKDEERRELERLRSLARSYDGGEIDAKFAKALSIAANARSMAAAQVLAQEAARVQEEDDFMVTAFMAVIDD